ncbi:MAG TPA: hypothetical protein VGQ76_08405 [Thermoanaerobaculia bacterium]|nr:hypothetical protein [Thermoanaerobaculia bacterium]
MKRTFAVALLVVLAVAELHAARVTRVRTHRGRVTRVHVAVRPGFPIRRTLPNVVVRHGVVRVTPRVYLGATAFTAVAIASLPPANTRAWTADESLDREDGWTDFSMNFDRRGTGLLLEVDRGPAQISFAEVVFENGDAQVVDFDERTQTRGVYSLLNFRDGRKVDHVRVVAQAKGDETRITLHLVK